MSPLEGARVLVTRPEGSAGELRRRLEAEGAVPIECPTIRIDAPESPEGLDLRLGRIDEYGWVVFTSANAVEAVARRASGRGDQGTALARARVACVGPATRDAVEAHGIPVIRSPREFTARRLAETLEPVAGERILFPRGNLGGTTLVEVLRERGATVDEVVVYRTVPCAPAPGCREELERGVDAVTFTSPSTVRGFVSSGPEWRALIGDAVVATIGPTTSAAVRDAGLADWVEAREHTSAGLVEAVATALVGRRLGLSPESTVPAGDGVEDGPGSGKRGTG